MTSAAVMMGMGLGINIAANYIFVVLMGMGVEGAALGTNIGMIVYTITSFIYFRSGKASLMRRHSASEEIRRSSSVSFHWDFHLLS